MGDHSRAQKQIGRPRIPMPPSEELIKLRQQGLYYEEIAEYYTKKRGRTVSKTTVYSWYKKLNLHGQLIPPEKELRYLYEVLGLSIKLITQHYREVWGKSISRDTVSKWLKNYKIPISREPHNKIPMPNIEELIELRERGMSHKQIAVYYTKERGDKISKGTVRRWLRNIGIEGRFIPPKEDLRYLYEELLLSTYQIAKHYSESVPHNIDRRRVSGWLKYYKIPIRLNTPPPRPQKEALIVLREQGLSAHQIAQYYRKKWRLRIEETVPKLDAFFSLDPL